MKITFLLLTADAMGGTERATLTQAEFLAQSHDVEVISVFRTGESGFFEVSPRVRCRYLVDATGPVPQPVRPHSLDEDTCRTLSATRSQLMSPSWEKNGTRLADLELEHALRAIDTDILVSTSPALMAVATTLAPPGVATVHQEHRPSQLRGGTGYPLFQYLPRLDALVVLTERTRAWFAESFADACPRLQVIPNAIPPGFRPRSTLTEPVVALAGRLVPEKRVDHAIRAFARVAAAHPDWRLRIFGDGPLLGELRRLAADLGLHDHVQLLGPTPRMAEEWAKASVALLSSRDGEALPLVLLEAFAAGVPAVSYDIQTGPAELITHGWNGFLVASGDEDSLGEAMLKLIADAQTRWKFGEAALRATEQYQIEPVMARWERLYADLLATRDAGGTAMVDRLATWLARTGGTGFAPAVAASGQLVTGDPAEAERRIAAATPGLVRAGDRLSVVADDLTPADAAYHNFICVVDVFERRGVPYWVIRDHGVRHRVAVRADRRDEVLRALAEDLTDLPVYAETVTRGGKASAVALAASLTGVTQATAAAGLRVFRPVVSTSRTLRYGPAYGCDVEFWVQSASEPDVMVPTRRTLLGDTVPEDVLVTSMTTIRQRTHPSVAAFDRRLVADVDFPIDIVYTWVDGADPAWLARKNQVLAVLGRPPVDAADGAARFRDREELRYSLRSVDLYAPWVRRIYLVTAGQAPYWLDTDHPRIRIVDHGELFADRGALPTFNSHAIESQLHHIEGLAEHFLYFNDDFFLGRPVQPTLFFHANGLSKFFLSPTPVAMAPVTEADDFNFSAGKNNRRLIEERFGCTLTHGMLHSPYPMRRSVGVDLDREFPAEIARTAASQVRSHADISVASSLHHYYSNLTGRAVPGSLRTSYVNTGDAAQHPHLTRLLTSRTYDTLCLNDTHHGDLDAEEQRLVVAAFLESYFPVASCFEKGSPRNASGRQL